MNSIIKHNISKMHTLCIYIFVHLCLLTLFWFTNLNLMVSSFDSLVNVAFNYSLRMLWSMLLLCPANAPPSMFSKGYHFSSCFNTRPEHSISTQEVITVLCGENSHTASAFSPVAQDPAYPLRLINFYVLEVDLPLIASNKQFHFHNTQPQKKEKQQGVSCATSPLAC